MATATAPRPLEVRAVLRYGRFSAYKAREVLDLIRGKDIEEARSILLFTERGAAVAVLKVLDSAIANAGANNDIPPHELYVTACFADEGPTLRRFRPRARGRGTRIRKRTCHVTVVLARLSATELERKRVRDAGRRAAPADARAARARRVAKSRKSGAASEESRSGETVTEETVSGEAVTEVTEEAVTEETVVEETTADEPTVDEAVAEESEVAEADAAEAESDETESNEKDA
ncbi:MAG: 50S ribosomal protein L22 [Microthrixaceae bacterium]|nr:50S ribosomal protein L22 [Microthrixaceae bacterium]